MNTKTWLKTNAQPLTGKWVAITGATGGLGKELCRLLAQLDASLILLDRNRAKSDALCTWLTDAFPTLQIKQLTTELSDLTSVHNATEALKALQVDILIHNAGAYSIPRKTCATGLDNVFQINFASPYYLTKALLPQLAMRENAKVVVVGSIAHNYSVTDEADPDFSTRSAASKAYGNAKRFLMGAMYELFSEQSTVSLSVVHPGITFTGITAHYPKLIFAIIKHPMKVIFMRPAKAALSIIKGLFDDCGYLEWIGPRWFDIWGLPQKRALKTILPDECKTIGKLAEEINQQQTDSLAT